MKNGKHLNGKHIKDKKEKERFNNRVKIFESIGKTGKRNQ